MKCKIALGQEQLTCKNCCYFCDHKDGCEDICDEYENKECDEMIQDDYSPLQIIQKAVPEALQAVCQITLQKKKLDEQEAIMKEKIKEAMERNGIKSFETPEVKFTLILPSTRTTIDSAKLKKKYPDIAEECSKTSNVKSGVRISVK